MQIRISGAASDRLENQKLDKVRGSDYSPAHGRRKCTDFLFLILLVASWAAMTVVGFASTGFVQVKSIEKGDPNRLVNGMDYHGNICGITNYVTPNGNDVINLSKAYPMPSGYFVCVESCPVESNLDNFFCEYGVQSQIEQTLRTTELAFHDINNTRKNLYMMYTASKRCMPQIESISFLGYCVPQVALEDAVLFYDSDEINTRNQNVNTTVVTLSPEKKATNGGFYDKAMTDIHTARYVIFSFGCGMAMVLGIIFLVIIQVPGILSTLVWSMIISVDLGLFGAGYYTKNLSLEWTSTGKAGNEAAALYYASYVLYVTAGLWFVIICWLRKRIVLAIACVREASRAISSMLIITVYPAAQVLGLVAFTTVWGIYMVYLASSGEIEGNCMCPSELNYLSEYNVSNITIADSSGDSGCNEGCFIYKEFTYSKNTKYAGLYLIFAWFWTSQFIVAFGQIVVSLSISLWYFSRDKKLIGNGTFFRALLIVSVYHLGTAAFGSLIIAIIKTLRAILTYIEKKSATSRKKIVIVILKMLRCFLWCVEKCMKFISKQAYIQTAIFGYSFCKGARAAFFLILRNALRISAVSVVSQFILFIGKAFITVASTIAGYYYLDVYFSDQLNFLTVPTLLIALAAYAISEMFNEVFGMAICTILQCFVIDEEMFSAEERFAEGTLANTIDSTQQKFSKDDKIHPK